MRLIDTDKLILNLNDYEIYDEKCIVDNLSQFGEPLNCTGHQLILRVKIAVRLKDVKFLFGKACTTHETTYRIWTWRFEIPHAPKKQ